MSLPTKLPRHFRALGQIPSQFARREPALPARGGFERRLGKRRHVDPAEQVVHHGIAGDHHQAHRLAARHLADQFAEPGPNRLGQPPAAARNRVLDAAHHIGAISHLWIQCRLHGQSLAGLEIQQLRGECGRP
jgi:hypothetical protein